MASVFKRGGKSNRHGNWMISWFEMKSGRLQRRCKSSRTTDKATAERIANKLEADAALRREGVIDPALESIGAESKRTIESHLKDYQSKLEASNRSQQYVRETVDYIRKISDAAGFNLANDIGADGVNQFANSLRDKNLSARTVSAHLTAIKGFTKWLSNNHKLPRDPLASVSKPSPDSDRRLVRRMLLPDEWRWIETIVAAKDIERYGMQSNERVLLYESAIQTGLRSRELRSLTRGRFHFDVRSPFVTCRAGTTKNKREARQYIQSHLAERLKAHIATKVPRSPAFGMPDESKVASMFRDDLADARKAWLDKAKSDPQEFSRRQESDFLLPVNYEGETADFHALRHTCGAWLAKRGVHPKTVQTIMRHSTITLTMDTYGHLFPGQEVDAVSEFGHFMGPVSMSNAATGTYDSGPEGYSTSDINGGASLCDVEASTDNSVRLLSVVTLPLNVENSATRCPTPPSATMLCCPEAPLAQLAEQLTLNQ